MSRTHKWQRILARSFIFITRSIARGIRKISSLSFHLRVCRVRLLDSLNFARNTTRTRERDRSRATFSSFSLYLHSVSPPLSSHPDERRIQSRGVVTAFPRRNDPSFFPLALDPSQTRVPRSFLLTLAFSTLSPRSEDQLECLGVLRVPAIIPRSR